MDTHQRTGRAGEDSDLPYVVRQSLATVERQVQEGRLPLSVQWRMARDIRVLLRLEELRFSQADREDAWHAVVKEAEALFDAEALQD